MPVAAHRQAASASSSSAAAAAAAAAAASKRRQLQKQLQQQRASRAAAAAHQRPFILCVGWVAPGRPTAKATVLMLPVWLFLIMTVVRAARTPSKTNIFSSTTQTEATMLPTTSLHHRVDRTRGVPIHATRLMGWRRRLQSGCPEHARVNPTTGYCKCDPGFVNNATGDGCRVGCPAHAHENLTAKGTCICDEGYVVDAGGFGCEPQGEGGCPSHAHDENGTCTCDEGYMVNAAGSGCEPQGADGCPPHAHDENGCVCDAGYHVAFSRCTKNTCASPHSHWQVSSCACDDGFQLNAAGNACEKAIPAKVGEATNLRTAFVPGPGLASIKAWRALGWNNTRDPCTQWLGVSCRAGRVDSVVFGSIKGFNHQRGMLGFTLDGQALARLTTLKILGLAHTRLSGTLPSAIAQLPLTQVSCFDTALSGTVPESLGQEIKMLGLSHTRVSGTIPLAIGELDNLDSLSLLDTALSGTIPAIGGLQKLRTLELSSIRALSGTIPDSIEQLTHMTGFDLSSTQVSGSLPSFGAHVNMLVVTLEHCKISGTVPLTWNAMRSMYRLSLHNSRVTGVQDLSGCNSLKSLDIGNCLVKSLPIALPSSIDHLYLNHNPLNASASTLNNLLSTLPNLHVLDIGFINIHTVLEPTRAAGNFPKSFGSQVATPDNCHVGQNCAFRLDIFDEDNDVVEVGGLLSNLTLRLDGLISPMTDMRNGSFLAQIPGHWITSARPVLFHFFHFEDEFYPMTITGGVVADGADCPATGGGRCKSLRTISFLPKICAGLNTVADADTGSVCECAPGFVAYSNESNDQVSCHVRCTGEDVPSRDGRYCECTGTNYDTQATGVVLCVGSGSVDAALQQFTSMLGPAGKCRACPACATCEGGVVTLHAGWRLNASDPNSLKQLIAAGRKGRLQIALRCPGLASNLSACPALRLTRTEMSANLMCKTHHTGHLCAVCERQFSLRDSDNTCIACDASDQVKSHFGISAGWFSVLIVTVAALFVGVLFKLKNLGRVQKVKEELQTPCKIMLGQLQVLALLKDELNLVFPPNPRHVMSYAELFTADVRSLVMFDCMGWTWYEKWWFLTLGVPVIAATIVAVRYILQRYRGHVTAHRNGINALFFAVMVLYPQVSDRIFSVLRCRKLGGSLTVLEVDYSISCDDSQYQHLRLFAQFLIVIWPIGIPLGLSVLLFKQWRSSQLQWDTMVPSAIDHESAGLRATEARVQIVPVPLRAQTLTQFHYDRIEPTFGFCTAPYRAECFWFEPVDMLRKLCLTGLLQFVQRGSAEQVLVGCTLAFCSFGLQQRVQPYRESEANALKALVDTQIFLSFLICFILRVLPQVDSFESVGADTYGDIFVGSLAIVVASAIGFVAKQVHRRKRFRKGLMTTVVDHFEVDVATTGNPSSVWSTSTNTEQREERHDRIRH
jgi:hypothetical protein